MDTNPKKYFSTTAFVKKYFPYAFLILLTLVLMIFFKHNKKEIGQFLEIGKNNLITFYSQNLKPLLFQTQISEEDIFNFALYQSLPVDKEKNKILVLNKESSGNQVYEIRSAAFNSSTHNYDSFKKYLNLNDEQSERVDSILNSYKKEIYSSVFVNDKNTFAVNPRINQLQQAILADLISFSQKVNKPKTFEIFQKSFSGNENKSIASLVSSAKDVDNNDFILITPDTVARTHFAWDREKFNNQMYELERNKELAFRHSKDFNLKVDLAPVMEEVGKNLPKDLSYTVNPELYKVVVPINAGHISKIVQDSLKIKLSEVAHNLKMMAAEMKRQSAKNRFNIKIPIPPTPHAGAKPDQLLMIDPSEIVGDALEGISNIDFLKLAEYGMKMDSLSKYGNKEMNDSIKTKILEEISKMKKEFKKKKYNTQTSERSSN